MDVVETEKILGELVRYAQELSDGNFDSLRNIQALVVDLDLVEIASQVDEKALAVLYLIKRLVKDFWFNLATDASFDFPEDDPLVNSFSKELSSFIWLSLNLEDEKTYEDKAITYLFKAIKSYYMILLQLEKMAEKV